VSARLALTALLLAAVPAGAAETLTPLFADDTAVSGVSTSYDGDWRYMVGGGASSFDCNGDLYPDLLVAGGEAPAALYVNRSTKGGALKFEVVQSGLELKDVTGGYPLDVDSDGVTDVVLLRAGENVVMRGLGECRFERANEAWGFVGGNEWSTAFAAIWEKGSPWPTLAVGNYIDRFEELEPWGSCTDNWLHRPAAGVQGFAPPLALKPSFCPLSMMFTDWNRSGTPSLRMSNDREYYEGGQEQLWRIEPGAEPRLYTEAEGWRYLRLWGMGIASRDLDADGLPEYFLTSMADHKLQTLAKPASGKPLAPSYDEMAWPRGVTAHRPYSGDDLRPSTGWHAQFEDVNNDSLPDLFVAKGNVDKMPDFAAADPNNMLVQQADGKFIETGDASGAGSRAVSRGAILTDFNLDGLVDIAVVNRRENAQILRNATQGAGNWVQVLLKQDGSNRDAIGAWIEVEAGGRMQRREHFSGAGHVSGHLGFIHFGIGGATAARLRVIWPDGEAGPWLNAAANAFYVLDRAAGTATVIAPSR